MTDVFARVNGFIATSVVVHVPARGPWFADVDLESAPDISGRVTIKLGALDLVGTVASRRAGAFGLQRRMRVVAGAGGWPSLLDAKSYHDDGGVRALAIVQDAARAAGETLGDFEPASERVGIDYVRSAGPASKALEDAIGSTRWVVGYDGVTVVGDLETSTAPAGAYQVLEYDARAKLATLAVDDLTTVGIGSIISDRLDEPQTIRELRIEVGETVRVQAWCGDVEEVDARLVQSLRAIIARAGDGKIFGSWRYRVVRVVGDRLELQAVRRDAGLPDLALVSMWPGIAGGHAELTPATEVLVEFIEGEPTNPIVTHFAGKDGAGFVPVSLALNVDDELLLGDDSASDFVALASLVSSNLTTLKSAINGATVVAGDGGASFKATLMTALAAWPSGVAATKVKAL